MATKTETRQTEIEKATHAWMVKVGWAELTEYEREYALAGYTTLDPPFDLDEDE